ncbi:hypothetical protein OB236_14495 [Paenibacillus sp. WQ 127069]|uniref:Uncharacterized protein n=1 Tax=Paenibacillus baimaensis TaxID=2982185 RepID=A0ABT2UFA0_9BACL|nr:hypothetical protein [Paenibacillus sp. WQ 127069]MCU6793320.1 hypothetical protein [Paenibacillus sp. WQ 127069]
MLKNRPIKLEDISQEQIMSNRRKLRQNVLKYFTERAAVTEQKTENVLLKV